MSENNNNESESGLWSAVKSVGGFLLKVLDALATSSQARELEPGYYPGGYWPGGYYDPALDRHRRRHSDD